jgi:oligopeptide transport system ATP-binding protein
MYAGRMVELGSARDVYSAPRHPYTSGLLRAIPDINIREDRLPGIQGAPPNMLRLPSGCAFHPRCPLADERCAAERPPFEEVEPSRWTACFHWDQVTR